MELKKGKLVRFYSDGKKHKEPSGLEYKVSSSSLLKPSTNVLPLGKTKIGGSKVFPEDHEPWRKRILDPGSAIVLKWNRVFIVSCLVALFLDPLYFYLPSVVENTGSSCVRTDLTLRIVVTFLRTIADAFYLLHIMIKFRTAYVAPSSRVFGRGELVMDPSFLLKSITREEKEEWIPFDSSRYGCSSALDVASPILREITTALHSIGIPVEQLHPESGNGQFEVVLEYTIGTKAADNLVYTRETIRAIARKHGLIATFLPKYILNEVGSGCHVHLSLWQNDKNVFMASDESSKYGISTLGEEFMAGVLHHLPSILPFVAPLPISYDRLQPMTGGSYLLWGNENRNAPLRASSPPGTPNGLVSNFEFKPFDGVANPYLGLTAIIAAGIDGLRRHLSLPEPIGTIM